MTTDDTIQPTIQDIANIAGSCFETRTREVPGEDDHEICGVERKYVTLKDGSPEWIKDAIKDAHDGGEMLPDDYVYATCQEAFDVIADSSDRDDLDDLVTDFADDVDTHNSELIAWLGSHPARIGYCNQGAEEVGEGDPDIIRMIVIGQATERTVIFRAILSAVKTQLGDD